MQLYMVFYFSFILPFFCQIINVIVCYLVRVRAEGLMISLCLMIVHSFIDTCNGLSFINYEWSLIGILDISSFISTITCKSGVWSYCDSSLITFLRSSPHCNAIVISSNCLWLPGISPDEDDADFSWLHPPSTIWTISRFCVEVKVHLVRQLDKVKCICRYFRASELFSLEKNSTQIPSHLVYVDISPSASCHYRVSSQNLNSSWNSSLHRHRYIPLFIIFVFFFIILLREISIIPQSVCVIWYSFACKTVERQQKNIRIRKTQKLFHMKIISGRKICVSRFVFAVLINIQFCFVLFFVVAIAVAANKLL